jgi:hypothetical protein
MYKSRVRKWKLGRKNKSLEMDAIMHKKVRRDAIGKATTFRLRGRPVDLEDVFRYFKRKKILVPQVATSDATTPSDVSYRTPRSSPGPTHASPRGSADGGARILPNYDIYHYDETSEFVMQSLISPLPRSVTPPQHLVLPEQLSNAIKIYFSGSLDSRAWISNEHDRLVSNRTSPAGEAQRLLDTVSQFSRLCNDGGHLLGTKDFIEAGQLLSRAFRLIRDMLTEERPSTLDNICSSLSRFLDAGFDDISTMLRIFIGQMAINVLPSNHPWCQICKLIGRASPEDVRTLSRNIWKCTEDTFVSKLGPFHWRVVDGELDFLREIQTVNDPAGAERRQRQLFVECEKVHGKSDGRSLCIALNLGWSLNQQGKMLKL